MSIASLIKLDAHVWCYVLSPPARDVRYEGWAWRGEHHVGCPLLHLPLHVSSCPPVIVPPSLSRFFSFLMLFGCAYTRGEVEKRFGKFLLFLRIEFSFFIAHIPTVIYCVISLMIDKKRSS